MYLVYEKKEKQRGMKFLKRHKRFIAALGIMAFAVSMICGCGNRNNRTENTELEKVIVCIDKFEP